MKNLNFEEFVKYVEENIGNELNSRGEAFGKAVIKTVEKGNGLTLTGLTFEAENGISPIAYLDTWYKDGKEMSKEAVLEAIVDEIDFARANAPVNSIPEDISEILTIENLVVDIFDEDINEDFLEKLVGKSLGNSFYATFKFDLDGAFVRLTKELAERLDMLDADMLYEAFLRKANHEGENYLVPMDIMMMSSFFEGNSDMSSWKLDGISEELMHPMFVFYGKDEGTDNTYIATFWSKFVQKKISEVLDGSYYVIPSSKYELLILPEKNFTDKSFLINTVKEINDNSAVIQKPDVLSYKVMYYSKDSEELTVIEI